MAVIKFYKDFSDSCEERQCAGGSTVSRILDTYGIKNKNDYVFFAGGKKVDSSYTVKDFDVVAIRRIPRGSWDTFKNVAWSILEPISYGIYSYNKNKKAKKEAEEASKQFALQRDDVKNIPYLAGASNTSATGKTQPYVIGTHKFTPYVMNGAGGSYKGYHTISGNAGCDSYYNVVLEGGFNKQNIGAIYSDDVKLANLLQDSPQEGTFPFESTSVFADKNSYIEVAQDGQPFDHDEFNDKIVETEASDQLYKHDNENYEDRFYTLQADACAADVSILWNGFRRYGNYAIRGITGYHANHSVDVIPSYSFDYAEKAAQGNPSGATWTDFTFDQPVFHDAVNVDAEAVYTYSGWIWCPTWPWCWNATCLSAKDLWIKVSGDDIKYSEGATFEFFYETTIFGAFQRMWVIVRLHQHHDAYVDHHYSNTFTYDTVKQMRFNAHVDFPFEALYRRGYIRTADAVIDESKTYYTYDSGTDTYTEVLEPSLSDLTTYYEYAWVKRYSAPITIRLRRTDTTPDSNLASDVDDCFVQYVHSYCMDEKASIDSQSVVRQKIINPREAAVSTLIGLHIKSTSANADKLGKINIVTSGLARVWDSQEREWSEEKTITSNPAAWVLEILTSPTHAPSKALDSEIDLDSFGEWYEFCNENGLSYDAVLTSGETKLNVLQPICTAGRAVLYRNIYGKIAVAVDGIKENASIILNSQNLISFEYKKELARDPDGLKITYIDASQGYVENTFIIMYDGSDASQRQANCTLREIDAKGITDYAQAWRYAHYLMNCQRLRPKKVTAKVGNEGFYYTPCSKILVQHESLKIGLGNAEIQSVINDGTNIIALELYDALDLDTENDFYVSVQCVSNDSVSVLTKKIEGFEGRTKEIVFETPIPLSSSVVPHAGDILSYGYGAETVTDEFLLSEISPDGNDGYTLSLVDYDEDIFDCGNMKDYIPHLTQPKLPVAAVPGDVPSLSVDEYKKGLFELSNGSEESGNPDDLDSISAKAEKDKIELGYSFSGTGLRNSVQAVEFEVCKDITAQEPEWEAVSGNSYTFNRTTDGYMERNDFVNWRFRAKVRSVYDKVSDNYVDCSVNTDSYGTWIVQPPSVFVRISDRTITLLMSQPARSDNREVYGNIRYKVQIRKPDFDEADTFYKPASSSDPYASELNYKDGEGFLTSDGVYVQTMPLTGQDTNDIVDTLYQFKLTAFNEAGDSLSMVQNAIAVCTSIRDIVKANETAKEAYISNLSAISANLGVISKGSLDGSDTNYWALSTITNEQTGVTRYEGAMRVGGVDEYLQVIPQVDGSGAITGYRIIFKVGNFEVTSEASSINGELIIQESGDSLDRTRITPTGTYYEHRGNSTATDWEAVAKQETKGLMSQILYSPENLVVTNMSTKERREAGHDIGKPYLTPNALVYHFDTDLNNQHGTAPYTLDYDEDEPVLVDGDNTTPEGVSDFTPAILSLAPYSEIGKSLYGQYSITHPLSGNEWTCDFWIQYIWAENQTLLDIGNEHDRIQIVISSGEPNYNEPLDGEPPYNYEILDHDEVVYNVTLGADNFIIHSGGTQSEYVSFNDLGISFEPNSWIHIAVVMCAAKLKVFIGELSTPVEFDRNVQTQSTGTAVFNVEKNSFILDELYIDTVCEEHSSFLASSLNKIPWASLDYTKKHFILDAKDLAQFHTNIFDSDLFRQKVLEIINEYHS